MLGPMRIYEDAEDASACQAAEYRQQGKQCHLVLITIARPSGPSLYTVECREGERSAIAEDKA